MRARGHGEVPEGWAGGQPAAAFVCTPIINASPLHFANNSRLSLSSDKWAPLKFSFLKSKAKKHFHNPASPPCPSQGLWCSQGGTAALPAPRRQPPPPRHCSASPCTAPRSQPGHVSPALSWGPQGWDPPPLFGAPGLPTASPRLELEVGAAAEHPLGERGPSVARVGANVTEHPSQTTLVSPAAPSPHSGYASLVQQNKFCWAIKRH